MRVLVPIFLALFSFQTWGAIIPNPQDNTTVRLSPLPSSTTATPNSDEKISLPIVFPTNLKPSPLPSVTENHVTDKLPVVSAKHQRKPRVRAKQKIDKKKTTANCQHQTPQKMKSEKPNNRSTNIGKKKQVKPTAEKAITTVISHATKRRHKSSDVKNHHSEKPHKKRGLKSSVTKVVTLAEVSCPSAKQPQLNTPSNTKYNAQEIAKQYPIVFPHILTPPKVSMPIPNPVVPPFLTVTISNVEKSVDKVKTESESSTQTTTPKTENDKNTADASSLSPLSEKHQKARPSSAKKTSTQHSSSSKPNSRNTALELFAATASPSKQLEFERFSEAISVKASKRLPSSSNIPQYVQVKPPVEAAEKSPSLFPSSEEAQELTSPTIDVSTNDTTSSSEKESKTTQRKKHSAVANHQPRIPWKNISPAEHFHPSYSREEKASPTSETTNHTPAEPFPSHEQPQATSENGNASTVASKQSKKRKRKQSVNKTMLRIRSAYQLPSTVRQSLSAKSSQQSIYSFREAKKLLPFANFHKDLTDAVPKEILRSKTLYPRHCLTPIEQGKTALLQK